MAISRSEQNAARPDPQNAEPGLRDSLKALRLLPRFFALVWRTQPLMTAGNVLLRLAQSAMPVVQLWVGKLIIDEVIGLAALEAALRDTRTLWMWVALEFGLVVLSALLNRAIALLDALLGDLFANESSVLLMEQAARLDLAQFEDAAFHDKMERARQQTLGRTVLMTQLLQQAQDAVSIVFLAGGLLVFNPWLLLILALTVVPVFFNESYFNQRTYSLTRNWTPERRELDYLRLVGASEQTAKEVKVFGLSAFLTGRFRELADRYYRANRDLSLRRALWGSVFNTLGDAGYYAAYVIILMQTVSGTISVGELTFLAGSFSRTRGLLQGMLQRLSGIAQRALYLQDLFDFLDMKPLMLSPEDPLPVPDQLREGFRFEQVGFRYPGTDRWVLRGLSFTLQAGEKLALVGENGAGKTTLVKLLSRLYDPSEGRILLEGRDLRLYDPAGLRELVGVIFQDYVRFSLTASENIAVGRIGEREDAAAVQEAAQRSLADALISRLPRGYDTMLGRRFDGGVDLSGGEWQKVALGRAYMRQAQLLILDEPTAALDARAEYEVFQRFAELTRGKTAVLISHRFSTVRMADRILVLKNGQMAELGSHSELLEAGGLYAELFALQARGYQ
jgi:ATP-binding cassette subfamily B protein